MTDLKQTMLRELVFATHNQGKLKELMDMVSSLDIKVYSSRDLHLSEPEETGHTFEENALDKARLASQTTNLPALSDDSGLVIPALGGAPGIYSARWGSITPDGKRDFRAAYDRIQKELGNGSSNAYFYCVLALSYPNGEHLFFTGKCDGHLVFPPRGSFGFGYDPIFVPLGNERTFGEMTMEEKKKFSARGQAFEKFWKFLIT